MEYFVIQTPSQFGDEPPQPRCELPGTVPGAARYPVVIGPFIDEDSALRHIEALHNRGAAGDGTWEYIFTATAVTVRVRAESSEAQDDD